MRMRADCDATKARRSAIQRYFATNVLASDFICDSFADCKASHSGIFLEGQLHHIGRAYDLAINDAPFRVVVVGQEYGGPPARVSLAARYQMIKKSGLCHRFKAGAGYGARNPHMRGTTSALRSVFGLPLGTDWDSEFLSIGSRKRHLFDAFALVNYLICSAIGRDERTRGLATQHMKTNCRTHFRKAIEILDPQIIIVQGKGFWHPITKAFDRIEPLKEHSYLGYLGDSRIEIGSFSHPSSFGRTNWGINDHTPYLLHTVVPTIRAMRNRVLARAA